MATHYEKTGKKGHGCCGGIFTLFLVCVVIFALLAFCTDTLGGIKNKVLQHFYPLEYSEYVTQYSNEYGVEESLIFAVIRTESGFRAEVESSVGAMGLMQIMPDTFDWLQNLSNGEVTHSSSELLDPETNIKYGTYFLSYLISHYNGNENLAVAAYNAGVANVDNWLTDQRYSSDGNTLTNIPYNETSQYVQRVESTKSVYESLYYDNN
ncbi:MAG: lytic transglycosylase domain-containing protein [Ruminococcaceae bacterium]|nr:lytic transglycosylase domain-containing protein [Oscillospiraceae bacterium]